MTQKAIGDRIAEARKVRGWTQAKLAEKLSVTYQAVSSWERDAAIPDTFKLIELAKQLGVSVSSLVEERGEYEFTTQKELFEWEHMVSFIRHTARAKGFRNTLKALDFAIEAHEGTPRKNSRIPYIYHPLNVACHCYAMGVEDDDILAACLLHDVVEDTPHTLEDLPVSERTKELVDLMTKKEGQEKEAYYRALKKDPAAALIKCMDRCNNMTTMAWGFTRKKIYDYIEETEKYVLPLLKVVKKEPDYNNAAWLLAYQMESTLDIYKRLM